MNELFDKLILRIVFAVFICVVLVLYKYAHRILYPTARQQIFQNFYPSKNSADTLHLFSRLLGVGIIFSEFYFKVSNGFAFATFDFLVRAVIGFAIYLVSIFVIESIVLYNFEYHDEVIKRKNFPYALISLSHALGAAYVLKTILKVASSSMIMLVFLWLFALVLLGFATKTFPIMSKLSFNRLLIQKNLAVAISYMGFFWGWALIISSALNIELIDIKWYSIQVILKILLSLIILPLFIFGIKFLFKLQDDLEKANKGESIDLNNVEVGYGIFEGVTFFTACFLTIVITGQVHFGTFYPIF